MRFLYVDIDTLRPDHLGCYGYGRDTSPTVDAIAAEGLRLDRVYASDVPCLPSRSALATGRFGIRNGAVDHGGVRSQLFPEPDRGFQSELQHRTWAGAMRAAGMRTASVSSFPERHSAWHWTAGFADVRIPPGAGQETAGDVVGSALDWLDRHGAADDWFLHVHLWDPHTPYRTPPGYCPFEGEPIPAWLTDDVIAAHQDRPGPHSVHEVPGYEPSTVSTFGGEFAKQPLTIADLTAARACIDAYDDGVRWADDHVARLVDRLDGLGVWDETAVLVSSDHGETMGELATWCDHQFADEWTCHVPAVLRWPGRPGGVDTGLHAHVDVAATVLELLGIGVPDGWDGRSFLADLDAGADTGRDHLVLSQLAWAAQRAVRFDDHLVIRTWHDAFHGLPEVLVFDVAADPHEQHDLSADRPDLVDRADGLLAAWRRDALARSPAGVDPLDEVMAQGGPFHVRIDAGPYLDRLRATGRGGWADHYTRRLARGEPVRA